MKKILIATHGKMAEGIKSAIHILTGMDEQIQTINAYVEDDNSNYTDDIRAFLTSLSTDDESFIFTDIIGGSVTQHVLQVLEERPESVTVITGVNLPIVLSVLLDSRTIDDFVLHQLLEESKAQKVEVLNNENNDDITDEDNFF